ncbi:MAG TPA: endonuclease/exonuclease/phosphatase family protein [Gemmatimonadales bacterium]|nr:endonuclease/exonuclease/phosphatase family protein [Gemmatimonadales bacterium]
MNAPSSPPFDLTLRADQRLAGWRSAVGAPLAIDASDTSPAAGWSGDALLVLAWNVWIGRGRLDQLVARIRETYDLPIVILAQEAFRSDETVPREATAYAANDFSQRAFPELDITAVARDLGLHLRFVPSMRNGVHRSDRGNAILSSLPLEQTFAWELPFSYQRRVAIATTLRLPDGRAIRVCSAHLDPRGGSARDLLGVLGRGVQAEEVLKQLDRDRTPVILGADLNLARGRRERAYRVFMDGGFRHGVPERPPAWPHTYHRLPRLLLDWMLVRDPDAMIAALEIERVDEEPQDRGPYVFGSDHHPLLARLSLVPAAAAEAR